MSRMPAMTRGEPTSWPTPHTYPTNRGEDGYVAPDRRYTVSGNPYISANRETMKPMYVPWAFQDPLLRNRGHRLLQDFRILASPLREPGDDQQNRPKEEDRKTDELRRDRGALAVGSLHDEPLGQARNRGPRDTEEPSNVPVREEVHLSPFEVPVHVFAPRLLSRRPYQYIAPMKTRPITTWAAKPPTAHGQGVSRRKVPENGEPAILTPASGSTTGPLAFVKRPYSVGIGGLPLTPLTVGAAGMFPTFCTETPTWRWRKVGRMDRRTRVALYWVFGVSANDDEPIH